MDRILGFCASSGPADPLVPELHDAMGVYLEPVTALLAGAAAVIAVIAIVSVIKRK